MNIRCMIVDDEPLALNRLKRQILKFPYLDLVAVCHSAENARRVLETNQIDLIYTDINMPDINGLDFIKTLEEPPVVVFVTAYPEYAVESYKVNALDYLLKPYSSEDFERSAEKIYKHLQMIHRQNNTTDYGEEKAIYLKCDSKFVRTECDDIRFVEGNNEYLKVHLVSEVPFLTHMTFRQISAYLPKNFIQIHRSYIVNMKHVMSIERTQVTLDDKTILPVSDTRRGSLLKYMNTKQ